MKKIDKKKKIQGRLVQLFSIDTLYKKVGKSGTSGHVIIPRQHLNRDLKVEILVPQPFICEGCHEVITWEDNFSPNPKLCISCYKGGERFKDWEKKPKKQKICRDCKNQLSNEEFKENWDQDQHIECAEKESEKEEEYN